MSFKFKRAKPPASLSKAQADFVSWQAGYISALEQAAKNYERLALSSEEVLAQMREGLLSEDDLERLIVVFSAHKVQLTDSAQEMRQIAAKLRNQSA